MKSYWDVLKREAGHWVSVATLDRWWYDGVVKDQYEILKAMHPGCIRVYRTVKE